LGEGGGEGGFGRRDGGGRDALILRRDKMQMEAHMANNFLRRYETGIHQQKETLHEGLVIFSIRLLEKHASVYWDTRSTTYEIALLKKVDLKRLGNPNSSFPALNPQVP